MRIAIIGTGIAGNAAAYLLSNHHHVTVYERELRPGGHSRTIEVDHGGEKVAIDTGFIVYNEGNYPNLSALFAHLGVETQRSDMGFSVSLDGGRFEWAGLDQDVPNGLFAQRRNLVSIPHIRMLLGILGFQKQAREDLFAGRLSDMSLGQWLETRGINRLVRDRYIVPMGAAIWSTPFTEMLEFPAASFFAFCENHRLLSWQRPKWRTVVGGSRVYVEKMVATYRNRLRLGAAVTSIERSANGVTIKDALGHEDHHDQVVIAAHSDQALAMLDDPTPAERAILGAIRYRSNDIYIHRDPALMPRRRAAWTSWNYLGQSNPKAGADVTLTYWMNALQGIDPRFPTFVTLNPAKPPRADLTFGRWETGHPQYDVAALTAQGRLGTIQGKNHTWYAGAWTGHGFHEDGLKSAMEVAEALGARVPWHRAEEDQLVAAAE